MTYVFGKGIYDKAGVVKSYDPFYDSSKSLSYEFLYEDTGQVSYSIGLGMEGDMVQDMICLGEMLDICYMS